MLIPATRFALASAAAKFIAAQSELLRRGLNMIVRVFVTLKNGVLDPQGKAIHHALEGLGFAGVNDVRAGRLFELNVDETVSDADLDTMCQKLLANMVIENYRIEKVPA